MADYSRSDLKACARLLSSILQADSKEKKTAARKSVCIKKRFSPVAVACPRRPKRLHAKIPRPKRHMCDAVPPDDSLQRDIDRIVEIKHQLMQPPTLNHAALLPEQHEYTIIKHQLMQPPTLDQAALLPEQHEFSIASVDSPYNDRLPTSTPDSSPTLRRKAESKLTAGAGILKESDRERAMNSYGSSDLPPLLGGYIRFQPNTHTERAQRFEFSRKRQDELCEKLVKDLKPHMPVVATNNAAAYSLYSEDDDLSLDAPTRDTDQHMVGRPLRTPISPFNAASKPQPVTKSFPNFSHHYDVYQRQARANKTPTTRDPQEILRPSDVTRLSRSQLLQAALKVALDSGALDGLPAFKKRGPISPFRPGPKRVSAASAEKKNSAAYEPDSGDNTAKDDTTSESDQREASSRQNQTVRGYSEPKLRDSVADLHIPDQPIRVKQPKTCFKSASKSNDAKKPARNKKLQFATGNKKPKSDGTKTKKTKTVKSSPKVVPFSQRTTAKPKHGQLKTTSRHPGLGYNPKVNARSDANGQTVSFSPDVTLYALNRQDDDLTQVKQLGTLGFDYNPDEDKENVSERTGSAMSPSRQGSALPHYEKAIAMDVLDVNSNSASDKIGQPTAGNHEKYHEVFANMKHLVKELKALPGIKIDKEGKRLLKELDDKVSTGQLDLHSAMDLVTQPLRTENAQLRRRLRLVIDELSLNEKEIELIKLQDSNNFTAAQLEMLNANLGNELQSQRQLTAKLKEEVQLYRKQLDQVLADKTKILTLASSTDGASGTTSGLIAENKLLQAQVEAVKERSALLIQDRDETLIALQSMRIECVAKEQEVQDMRQLVRVLEESMQSVSRGADMASHTKHISALIDRLSPERVYNATTPHQSPSQPARQPTKQAMADHPLPQTSQYNHPGTSRERGRMQNMPSRSREASPMLRSYSPAPNNREVVTPQEFRSPNVRAQTAPLRNNGVIRSPAAQVQMHFSKTAESLSVPGSTRKSLSPGGVTETTEYRMYPGTSPMHGSAFESLDPFIKDMIQARRIRQEEATRTTNRAPADQQLFQSTSKSTLYSQSTLISVPSLVTESEARESVSTGLTVKELLTPLAERMQRIHCLSDTEKSRAVRAINFDAEPQELDLRHDTIQAPPIVPPLALPLHDSDDSVTIEIKKDLEKLHYEDSSSTVVTDSSHVSLEMKKKQVRAKIDDADSRYSVNDYFDKYPDASGRASARRRRHSRQGEVALAKESLEELLSRDKSKKVVGAEMHERIDRWAQQVVFSPNGVPILFDDNSDPPTDSTSPQVELYRGTDLDTSLSTIGDRESATTTGTISSVDDRIFRQGLANLDANIERVQKSLRNAMK